MPMPDRRVLSILATALAASAAACATSPEGPDRDGFVRDVEPLVCPNFTVGPMAPISVGPSGGDFNIPGGHRLEFGPGAVQAGSTYEVRAGPDVAQRDWAQIEIVPQPGATTEFGGDVFLELSYAACPDAADEDPVVVMTESGQGGKSIGGRNVRNRMLVRALVPHLSEFAIAR